MIKKFLILIPLLFLISCSSNSKLILKTERDFQKAFNDIYFDGDGKLEVSVKYGRVDILTDDFAIEVDRLEKFHEGIGQSLHYAEETGKKPGLAIFIINPGKKDLKKLNYVKKLCGRYKIKVWYINKEIKKVKK
ncbi:MAG: hypothetical protein GY714_17150 [Desulfobacterales bacterium]|nr:hypothetical protein [Desulfobacterales bacterium]MCP4159168.1 hypothetical protein [Deltaproteobacteria bacterium]